jgi:hypothetical protein
MNNVGRAIRPPIVVGDSPPYGFYGEFTTFYDASIAAHYPLSIIHCSFASNGI